MWVERADVPGPGLAIIPCVPVWKDGDEWVFDRKFYDGLVVSRKHWRGMVRCIMRLSHGPKPTFGTVAKTLPSLPFALSILGPRERVAARHLYDVSVVLAAGDAFDQFPLSQLCRRLGKPIA